MQECVPEIVMMPPSSQNNWKWEWAICDPENCWGEYEGGIESDEATAREKARQGFLRTIQKHFPGEYQWAFDEMYDDRRRYNQRKQKEQEQWMERVSGKKIS